MEQDDAVYLTFNQVQDRIDFMFSQTGEKPSYQKAILGVNAGILHVGQHIIDLIVNIFKL